MGHYRHDCRDAASLSRVPWEGTSRCHRPFETYKYLNPFGYKWSNGHVMALWFYRRKLTSMWIRCYDVVSYNRATCPFYTIPCLKAMLARRRPSSNNIRSKRFWACLLTWYIIDISSIEKNTLDIEISIHAHCTWWSDVHDIWCCIWWWCRMFFHMEPATGDVDGSFCLRSRTFHYSASTACHFNTYNNMNSRCSS